jgi:hypothetical protein
MKKLIFTIAYFVIISSFLNISGINAQNNVQVTVINSNDNETIIEFNFNHFDKIPVTINGDTFYKLMLEKGSQTMKTGFPELPMLSRSVIIPDDKKVSIEILEKEASVYSYPVIPSKGNLFRDQDPASVPYTFGDIYEKDEFYPSTLVEIGTPYILRDFRGINVKVFPFSYNPVQNIPNVYHKVVVRLSYSGKDLVNIKTRKQNTINKFFEPIYEQHFINYESGGKYPMVGEDGRIIVICYSSFMDEIAPYVEWKIQKGIQTDLYDVATIGNTTTNIDNFIQNQYNLGDGLTFVQLVGDAAQVVTPTYSGGGSDPSYSLVEGNDEYPDIVIGRFSAENSTQIETQVERTIHYERELSWGGWLAKGTGIASDQGSGFGWQGYADWEHMDYLRNMLLSYNYTIVDQFYDTGTPTASDVSNSLNEGRGNVNYCGHGSTYSWATTGFSSSDINNLVNDYKLPFIHSVGCVNGNFVSSTCFAETWLRATNDSDGDPTGAIAMYASSINQSWSPPMVAQDYSTQHLVYENFFSIGALWYNGSCAMIDIMGQDGVDMFMTWHIFGDASLSYRSDTPNYMSVSHPGGISDGQTSFTVNTDEPGALVCLSCPGQIVASGYANSSGDITLSIPSYFPCNSANLTVSAYNQITYTSTIIAHADGRWTGAQNNNWHDPDNWANFIVPSLDEEIIIPSGCPNYPSIYAATANCSTLTIESGASLTIYNEYFNVYGDLRVYGNLQLTLGTAYLSVQGSIHFEDGSVLNVQNDAAGIECYGQWYNRNGATVQLDNGTVYFVAADMGFITNHDPDCYFNDITINKTSGSFRFHPLSSFDLVINGDLNVTSGDNFTTNSEKTIILNGNLTCNGNLSFDDGTFKLTGSGKFLDFNSGDYVNNFHISTIDGSILNSDIQINGDFKLYSGGLVTMADIYIKGSWFNYGGTGLFAEGTNKVDFNGNGKSYIYGEDFYSLVLSGGGELYFQSGITSCQNYDWVNGNLWMKAGTVNIFDLADNGLFGTIIVDDGTMNIYQDITQYADLNCELYLNGGTVNIYSSTGDSYWGIEADCEIVIEDGILDFKNGGIRLYDSPTYNLGGEINGGLIRTVGSLRCDDHNINITEGTFELYGTTPAYLRSTVDHLHNVIIDKNSKDVLNYQPIPDSRNTDLDGKIPKANNVDFSSNIFLDGDLTITSGTLNCAGYTLTVSGDLLIESNGILVSNDNHINLYGNWTNNHGTAGFIEGYGQVNFLGSNSSHIYTNETFFDLETNKTGSQYDYVWIENNNTVTVTNDLIIGGCSFRLGDFSTLNVYHDLIISENTNLFASSSEESYINVGNNWFNYNTTGYPWTYGFYYGMSTVTFNGTDDQFVEASYGTQDFYNLKINKADNWFMPIDHLNVFGDAEIVEGSWNQDATGLMFSFFGDLIIQANGSWDDYDNNLFFKGSEDTYIKNYGSNNAYFESIYILKDLPTNLVGLIGNLHCYYLSVSEGEIFLNSQTVTCDYRIQIAAGGILSGLFNSTIKMADQATILVGGGGVLKLFGDGTNNPKITHTTGYYGLSIYAGGILAADWVTFEYMNTNGVYVYNNGLIDDVNSLHNCTFKDGQSGGTLIRLATSQAIDIENAYFPANTWGGAYNVSKTLSSGEINFYNATGDFSGEVFENDPNNLVNWEIPGFDLDVKVYLEGPYENGLMNFDLMPEIPLTQPYNDYPWNYDGTESVSVLPGKTVDWVLIELRDAPSAAEATGGTVIARQAAFVKNNGYILDLDGTQSLSFEQTVNDQLFLVIWHRNHLAVMSAYPLVKIDGVYSYDFSTAVDKAYGDEDAHKEIAPNVYGMFGGDANRNGAVNSSDKGYWNVNVGKSGYLYYDFNLDSEVDNQDKNDVLLENYGRIRQVPY